MYKYLSLFITAICLHPVNSIAQQPFTSIQAVGDFKKEDLASSYFNSISNTYHINFQNENKIYRQLYDTGFHLLNNYSFESSTISYSDKATTRMRFIAPLCTPQGNFEIFSDKDDIVIYKIDFQLKIDSLYRRFHFENKKNGEKIFSLLPDDNDLKVMTHTREGNLLKIYKWVPGDSVTVFQYTLPEKNLTKNEEKIYSKDSQIKLTGLSDLQLASKKINTIQTLPKANQLYYTENRIYVLLSIPNSLGKFVIDIDLVKNELHTTNYFINKLVFLNPGDSRAALKSMVATVVDSTLIIQNSSLYRFEYHFYNLNTHQLIKSYLYPVKDSMFQLVHSDLIQKGTYASRNQEKEIDRERAFMRKVGGSFWYINPSGFDKDSVVFTLASLDYTEGIMGTLLSAATASVGFMANIHIGNLQIIPYLTSHRWKLLYAHSKFSIKTLEPSKSTDVTTALDEILDTFGAKELASNSSFFIQKNQQALIGILNKNLNIFEIYRFSNH